MDIAVVVGNPKPKSRTLDAATVIAEKLVGHRPDLVIDVVDLGAGLLGWNDPAVSEAVRSVRAARHVVFASPTFKATYSGLLKLFLDQIPGDGLAGVTAFSLMLGAGPHHALAPELLLKPVLVELGATCPARALYLLDSDYRSPEVIEPWLHTARGFIQSGVQA